MKQLGILLNRFELFICELKFYLGKSDTWHFLLATPLVLSLIGGLVLFYFFPESPKALLIIKKDEDAALKGLLALKMGILVFLMLLEIIYHHIF